MTHCALSFLCSARLPCLSLGTGIAREGAVFKEVTGGLVSKVLAEAVSGLVKANLPETDFPNVHLSPASY